jgi:hypothetical protein
MLEVDKHILKLSNKTRKKAWLNGAYVQEELLTKPKQINTKDYR